MTMVYCDFRNIILHLEILLNFKDSCGNLNIYIGYKEELEVWKVNCGYEITACR